MGKLTLFTITLDTRNPVYTAGSTLQGCVTLELAEPMKMRGIRLRFYGGANVHWSERHTSGSGKNRRTTTRHYRSSQNYFDYMLVLYGKAPNQDGDNPVHPAGRHQYPFHYTLPQNLPSSFEGPHGQVRYWINCNIDKPWKFDHNSKIAYTVLSMLDLNNQANALAPQSGTNSKTLCCLCCESGPITAQFHIDRCGYVPGEFIVLSGEVSNHTNRTMDDNRVELRMYMTFRATTKTRTVMRMISRVSKGKIEAGGSAVWSGETFHIPPLPPSQLVYCDIIDIAYSIVVSNDPVLVI
ncbi:hypothetical protein CAPTEDRAFT_173828 [Capitella teleta]|uniref:Arrestin C-terminal-like domain-containing protein n=1 Tax=Capitella teleta TaxID=283909 RepID=R7UF51_CAPTE|nr:hypothetical protein CAPTEDRAFT_173828 [Capitella teleta]|eukprot:ELU04845.1 hypothetical protein CAPTEDRAFT_173828 [Capitella teleta]